MMMALPWFPRFRAWMQGSCRLNEAVIADWYRISMIVCKWFGC